MVTDQLSLLDIATDTPAPTKPRCRMCARPARWITTQQQYGMYCAGGHCSNQERICQQCGNTFTRNAGDAGTKYCSTACKLTGYRPAARLQRIQCAWCDSHGPAKAGRGTWPYICEPCIEPIKHVAARLKNHHVPHERVRQLVADPRCEVCGRDILQKLRRPGVGKPQALLVVDHDHECCPSGERSCGRCVRGLICVHCNSAAGMLSDSATRAQQLANYLRSHL